VGLHQCPSERRGEEVPVRSLRVPSQAPSHAQNDAKVRGISPSASGFTAETDCLLEEDGFELVVPPRTKRLSEGPGVAIWVSDMTLTGSGFRAGVLDAGQQQSPLQERDRRFESGSLQRRVSCEPEAGTVTVGIFALDPTGLGLRCIASSICPRRKLETPT
jgi:hypothetical protein